MKIDTYCLVVVLLFAAGSLHAQRAFYLLNDGEVELIRNVGSSSYQFGLELDQTAPIGQRPTRLLDYSHFMPGYIEVRDHEVRGGMQTLGANVGWENQYGMVIEARIRPDRDLSNVYMIVEWTHENGEKFRIACPIGELREGRTRTVDFEVDIPPLYRESKYRLAFFCEGIELRSLWHGDSNPTPFERYREGLGEEALADGQPQPLKLVRPEPVTSGGDGDPQRLVMSVVIDANGYVTSAEVEQSPGPRYSRNALEAVRLWEFKPRISEGEAVATRIRIPFDF